MSRFEQAKQISIIEYLNSIGQDINIRNKYKITINAFWRKDTNPSVSIDLRTNRWWDFGTGEQGTVIDLVSIVENTSTINAVNKLLSGNYHSSSFLASKNNKAYKEKRIEVIDVCNIKNPNLIQYLIDRLIPKEIYNKYLKEVSYMCNGKKYYGLGFKNDKNGWNLRNKFFKGCTNQYFTHIKNNGKELIVFEGFFDFLSYLTIYINNNTCRDYLILNSTVNIQKASIILGKYNIIHTFLDNDITGKEASNAIAKISPNKVINHSYEFKPYNDYNEWHMAKNGSK